MIPPSATTSPYPSLSTPVLGFAAFSGTGKTTLLKRLIPALTAQGLRLGLVKHTHHRFRVDPPGQALALDIPGAAQTVSASVQRTVRVGHYPDNAQRDLPAFLAELDSQGLDIILVEGFKHYPLPKLELHRASLGHPLLCQDDPYVLAVATDTPLTLPVPCLDLNDLSALVAFINEYLPRLVGWLPTRP